MRHKSKNHPTICVDEHLSPQVTASFRRIMPTIHAGKHHKYRGRDERDYLEDMYSKNIVFATSDMEFVGDIYYSRTRHAGIVYLPVHMSEDEKRFFAEVAATYILGGTKDSAFAFRGYILYPGHDGVRLAKNGDKPELALSWDSFRE